MAGVAPVAGALVGRGVAGEGSGGGGAKGGGAPGRGGRRGGEKARRGERAGWLARWACWRGVLAGPAWEAEAQGCCCSAAATILFPFSSDRKQKEKHRGIWKDFEKCDKIIKVLNLFSI